MGPAPPERGPIVAYALDRCKKRAIFQSNPAGRRIDAAVRPSRAPMLGHSPASDSLAGCGGAPPPAVDPISRAGYLSCPNDNAVHDRSGHPGGYHNPGWKKCRAVWRWTPVSIPSTWPTARQHRDRHRHQNRCTDRYFGRGGNPAVTVDPTRHTVVASNTAAGTASVHRTALMMPPTAKRGPHDER